MKPIFQRGPKVLQRIRTFATDGEKKAESAGLRVRKYPFSLIHKLQPKRSSSPVLSMASSKPTDQSQAKKKDNEKDNPVANGVKKDEPEELV